MYGKRFTGTVLGALALTLGLVGPYAGHTDARPTAQLRMGTRQYTLQAITNPNDPTFTQLLGINDHQTIAGYFGSGADAKHPNKGFRLSLPTTFKAENFPRSVQTQVIGINNQGDTGGLYLDHAGATHGFLKVNGKFETVDRPGTSFNQILGLNDAGQAAGFYQDAQGRDHGYVRLKRDSFTVLPINDSQATGINDAGTVVGFTQPSTSTAAGFIMQGGKLTILIYPGSAFTQALGENNAGQVVGVYNDGAGNAHGFVYDAHLRTFQTIDEPGATSTTINGINDAGDIVGFFTDANGNTVGLVGTPGTTQVTLPAGTATPTSTATATATPSATSTPTASPSATPTLSTTVKIGLVLPLSGADAALGLSAEHGAQLAIDQANTAHLIPRVNLALAPLDDAGATGVPDGAVGANDVTTLIKDPDVAGIIGPFDTATALTELPIANKSGIAMVSPSAGNPCLTSDNPTQQCGGVNSILTMVRPTGNVTFFRTVPTDPKQGTVLSDYLYLTKGYRTAYVIDDTGSYGVSEADAFLSEWQINGGVVLGRSSVPEGTASEVNLLTKIAALRPDVIFFGGSDPATGTPESITIRRQMEQIAGLATTPFAGTDGIRTSLFAQSIGLVGGPVWSTLTPADPGSVPAGNTFLPQYQAVYGTPGRYSASGYDSAEVLISAIAAAISNGTQPPAGAGAPAEFRKAVLAAVTQTKLQGVINPISFSADGDLTQGSISIGRLAAVNGAVGWQQVTAQSVR